MEENNKQFFGMSYELFNSIMNGTHIEDESIKEDIDKIELILNEEVDE